MDDPVFKSKYQKYKFKVKLWEKSFFKINGRIPSKHDIREAPLNIRDAYKMYYNLKSSFLEDTLNDVLDEDGFDLSMDNSQLGASFAGNLSAEAEQLELPTAADDGLPKEAFSNIAELATGAISNLRNVDEAHVVREFEAEVPDDDDLAKLNAKAWGANVGKSTLTGSSGQAKRTATMPAAQTAVRKEMTEKLFRNASFSKRNPRKSLVRTATAQLTGGADGLLSASDVLPDLETILMEKARKQQELELAQAAGQSAAPVAASGAAAAATSVTSGATLRSVVDQGWLNRCSAAHGLESDAQTAPNSRTAQPVKFGMTNLNVPLPKPQPAEMPASQPPVKEIYAQNTYADDIRDGDGDDDDDDEVIENSEDESAQTANASSMRHVLKKRKIQDVRPVVAVKAEPKPQPAEVEVEADSSEPASKPKRATKATAAAKAPKTPKTPRITARKIPKLKTSPKLSSTPTAAAVRRSTRAVRKPCQHVIPAAKEDNDEEEAATDSDGDPEFDPASDRNKRSARMNRSITSEEDMDVDDEKENPPKAKVKKAAKTSKPKSKPADPKTKNSARKTEDGEPDADEDDDDEPYEYGLEFGTEFAQSVPRIDVTELQANTAAFQDYVFSLPAADPQPSASASDAPKNAAIYIPLTKRELERDKLEKKMAAGKLNENYVRINIQKKKFSRGHKTTNFSKYKKGKWRQTKVANALAGPEMDMRGCDGGFLVCFSCGQQGHFAQDCKIQADRLLPLSADVEVSEFPTLAEVEQMAAEKALLVHSSRPDSLPATAARSWAVKESAELSGDEESGASAEEEADGDEHEDDGQEELSGEEAEAAGPSESTPVQRPAFIGQRIPEEFLKLAGYNDATVANSDAMQPLYSLDADGNVRPPTPEVMDALRLFGHTAFRKGQDRAVMRILSGQATLVTLSTGSGKSLCYQLPAYMYRQQRRQCITLVISPLVSLMEDQVHDVPGFLNAQCLHTNQSKEVRNRIMAAIKSGSVDVLLISPEAVVAGEKATGFGSLLRELPPIAFACIDEAHCMSQWSHNFRPSYLMICRVLQEKLKVRTVLGLTATATLPTRESIVHHLAIPDGMRGVISDVPLPNNLLLTVSRDANRDTALVNMLRTPKFTAFQSIIVYCTRRDECERVANLIRMCFQDEDKRLKRESEEASAAANGGVAKKRRRQKSLVEAYHAGLAASRRKKIQTEFMRSDLKIVVATIAFGMGINKADIRSVIHYNMPMTYENYTQEVGRAGRDGQPSHCHLFLEAQKADLFELRRHIFANSIDRHVIRKLLQKVFVPCACQHNLNLKQYQCEVDAVQHMNWDEDMDGEAEAAGPSSKSKSTASVTKAMVPVRRKCPGHECSFSIDETVQQLDIKEEIISTLLCYLELHEQRYIQVLSRAYSRCKVMSYGGPNVLKTAARTCAPLAMAIALDLKKGIKHDESTLIEFRVIDIASAIGWDSGIVKYQLKNLEWTTVNGAPKRTTISVQFNDLGFRVRSPGDLSDDELDATLDMLHGRVSAQERTQELQLHNVFNGLSTVAFPTYALAINRPEEADRQSEVLKLHIRDYFQRSELQRNSTVQLTAGEELEEASNRVPDEVIIGDVYTMMGRYPDNQFTGRTLARIFHGVASPVYPAQIWSRCNFWRGHTRVDFNRIVRLANAVIVKSRT